MSDSYTVIVERVDVDAMNGVAVTFRVTALFEVRDGAITHWPEYWDTNHVAQQLGTESPHMFAPLGRSTHGTTVLVARASPRR